MRIEDGGPMVFRFFEGSRLLTEQEVTRSWGKLFRRSKDQIDEHTMAKAEALLDELRPESPLRHRLAKELMELQTLYSKQR